MEERRQNLRIASVLPEIPTGHVLNTNFESVCFLVMNWCCVIYLYDGIVYTWGACSSIVG
jgi:hypothetical protein